jgi:hypothetical protein
MAIPALTMEAVGSGELAVGGASARPAADGGGKVAAAAGDDLRSRRYFLRCELM